MKDNNPLLVEERYYPWEPEFTLPRGGNSHFCTMSYDAQDSFKESIRRMICACKPCFRERKCAYCLWRDNNVCNARSNFVDMYHPIHYHPSVCRGFILDDGQEICTMEMKFLDDKFHIVELIN